MCIPAGRRGGGAAGNPTKRLRRMMGLVIGYPPKAEGPDHAATEQNRGSGYSKLITISSRIDKSTVEKSDLS